MAGTALDHRELGVGDQLEHIDRLGSHVLRPRMAREVDGDAARQGLQPFGQTLGVGDIDNILGDIRGVLGEAADRGIIGDDQRPLELEH